MREIIKAISTIDEFDKELFKDLNIGVEIQDFTEPNLTLNEKKVLIKSYKSLFKDFKGKKALHGPFLDLKPASPDKDIKNISYKKYLDILNISQELNIEYLIFHSQINPYLNEPFIINLNNEQSKEFWDEVLLESNYEGLILIENIFEENPQMLKSYIETINKENIKINLDIGHAKLGKVNLEEWIKILKNHIAYIHMHSNDGFYDLHVKMPKEEIQELYNLLEKYKIDPVLSLEYKTDNLKEELEKYN